MGLDYSVEIKAKLQGFEKLDEWDSKIKAMSQGVDIPLNLGGSGKNSVKTQAANIGRTINTGVSNALKGSNINPTIQKYATEIKKQFDNDKQLSSVLQSAFDLDESEANKMVSKLRSEANKIDSEAQRELNRIQQQATKIADDYKNNVLDNKMSNAASYLNQFSKTEKGYSDLEDSVYSAASFKQKLNTALADLSSNPSVDNQRKVVDLYNDFDNSLKSASNSAKILTRQNEKMVNGKNISALENKMRSFGENNTRMGKYNQSKLNGMINSLGSVQTVGQEKEIRAQFEDFKNNISQQGLAGKSLFGEIGRGFKQIGQFATTYGAIQKVTDGFVNSLGELKEVDSIITEISKTSDLTSSELKQLGNDSFEHASRYGMNASDYLYGVQEMSRSGFYGDKATELADLSVLTQAAGDVSSDIANSYLLATNAAYNYRGSVEKLNAVLDGQNMINKVVMPCRKLMAS